MRAIDTNVLLRLIVRDDSRQLVAAESFVSGGAWVPVLAISEAMWVLGSAYRLGANQVADAVEMLLNHKDLVLQDAETVTGALDLFRAKPALGFSDCLLMEMARKAGHLPLGTFDRDLSKVAGAHKL